jgi:hypothetical protein
VFPMAHPFQFIYMRVEFWANHVEEKGGAIGNYLGNPLGTSWEHDWNKGGKILKSKNQFPQTRPLKSPC